MRAANLRTVMRAEFKYYGLRAKVMAGPREQSADTSLDDILSSIRKIVSDDLNGAEQLREKLADAQAAAAGLHSRTSPEQPHQAAPEPQAPSIEQGAEDRGNTAALIAAARAAAGTPAREFVASEPQTSQAAVSPPRESLAPFDRSTTRQPEPISNLGTDLGAPIVLPTEAGQPDDPTPYDAGPTTAEQLEVPAETAEPNQPLAAIEEPFDLQETADDQINGHVNAPEQLDGTGYVNGQAIGNACMNGMANGHAHVDANTVAQVAAVEPVAEVPEARDPVPSVVEPAETPAASEAAAPGPHVPGISSNLLEQTVTRMLRPMLKDWLDENMPRLIEQALRDEPTDASPDGQA